VQEGEGVEGAGEGPSSLRRQGSVSHVGSSRVLQGEGRNLDREARDVGVGMYRVSKSDAVDGAMMMGQESSPARQ